MSVPLLAGCGGRELGSGGGADCDAGECADSPPVVNPGPPTGVQPAPEPVDAEVPDGFCCGVSIPLEAAEPFEAGDSGEPPDAIVLDAPVKTFDGGPLDPPDLPA